jgi:branched-chain amino acid transport system permease protein
MPYSFLARWGSVAAALVILPLIFPQGFALTLLTQAAVMIVFALSFNLLYGETGMLSFGHALYFGAGVYGAVHALNAWGASGLPVTLLPLAGGVAGALCALLTGWFSTRRGGLTFAMISLAMAELAIAVVPMLPGWFGGEGGVTTNRVTGTGLFGIDYGSALQVYALVATWLILSMLAMQAFTRTPLGRMANTVRDNAERTAFIGCDARAVRWRVMLVAGFFAGLAGALSVVQFEVATGEAFGHTQSAAPLIATKIGGAGSFFGPVTGAIIYVLAASALGTFTPAWPLYLGCLFVFVMLFAPHGVASILMRATRRAVRPLSTDRAGSAGGDPALYMVIAAGSLAGLAGAVGLVELTYLIAGRGETGELARLLGLVGQERDASTWLCAGALLATGGGLCAAAKRSLRLVGRKGTAA